MSVDKAANRLEAIRNEIDKRESQEVALTKSMLGIAKDARIHGEKGRKQLVEQTEQLEGIRDHTRGAEKGLDKTAEQLGRIEHMGCCSCWFRCSPCCFKGGGRRPPAAGRGNIVPPPERKPRRVAATDEPGGGQYVAAITGSKKEEKLNKNLEQLHRELLALDDIADDIHDTLSHHKSALDGIQDDFGRVKTNLNKQLGDAKRIVDKD